VRVLAHRAKLNGRGGVIRVTTYHPVTVPSRKLGHDLEYVAGGEVVSCTPNASEPLFSRHPSKDSPSSEPFADLFSSGTSSEPIDDLFGSGKGLGEVS